MSWKKSDLPYNQLPALPPDVEIETSTILKKAISANKYLAELKGYCQTLPSPEILINTIILQESKDSSEIENIVTTQDELYKAVLEPADLMPNEVKEVLSYRTAIYGGLTELNRTGVFKSSVAIKTMQLIKQTTASYRTMEGTKLQNPATGKIIYTPPAPAYSADMMYAWEQFLNNDDDLDPLIKMALMHYQFEAIHPFADGNGRTGRILNVLYLVHKELLALPVLYLSSYTIQHKEEYYRKLREVTEANNWEGWVIFMSQAIEDTAKETLTIIAKMLALKQETLQVMRGMSQKMPVLELNELIFSFPYIRIKTLIEKGIAKRQAASAYLQQLSENGVLKPMKMGRDIYYINNRLMAILSHK